MINIIYFYFYFFLRYISYRLNSTQMFSVLFIYNYIYIIYNMCVYIINISCIKLLYYLNKFFFNIKKNNVNKIKSNFLRASLNIYFNNYFKIYIDFFFINFIL